MVSILRNKEIREMIFKEHLKELLCRFPDPDPGSKVDIQLYFKWRIQVKWLLTHYLGDEHPYTRELSTMPITELDPYCLGSHLLMGKGILKGLWEDIDSGLIQIKE